MVIQEGLPASTPGASPAFQLGARAGMALLSEMDLPFVVLGGLHMQAHFILPGGGYCHWFIDEIWGN